MYSHNLLSSQSNNFMTAQSATSRTDTSILGYDIFSSPISEGNKSAMLSSHSPNRMNLNSPGSSLIPLELAEYNFTLGESEGIADLFDSEFDMFD